MANQILKKVKRTVSEKKRKSLYKYNPLDYFYDIESLTNVFTVSQIYPKGPEEYNGIVVSYIDDGYTDINGIHHDKIINSKEDLEFIRKIIYQVNEALDESVPIIFEDLSNYNPSENALTPLGLDTFMERFGVAYRDDYMANRNINVKYYPSRETDDQLFEAMIDVKNRQENNDYVDVESEPLPMKFLNSDSKKYLNYDINTNGGLRFGYNSLNYDMTILAYFMDLIPSRVKGAQPTNQNLDKNPIKDVITAHKLRQFNNLLFDKYRDNMSRALVETDTGNGKPSINYKGAYAIRSQWIATNRFLDVARFNEKQSKVALKRLSGFLGLPIIESDLLDESSSEIKDVMSKPDENNKTRLIPALEVLAHLIGYNISDDLNAQRLFENDVYQNNFKVKQGLIANYPQTVYKQNPATGKAFTSGFNNVRRDRLTSDSTSAKIIEKVVAPYEALTDIPTVSFMYPSARKAKELGVPQTNILEDSMKWAEENVPNGREAFQPIYDQYKAYEGRSANPQLPNKGVKLVSDIDLSQFDNIYYYRDANGNKTSSISVFTVGGIHGAEVKMDKFVADLDEVDKLREYQHFLETKFGSPEEAYSYRPDEPNPETNRPYKLGEAPITMFDGTIIKVKSMLKSGASRKKATWKEFKEPTLFDATGVRDKYRYTSSDLAHHEDFSSYYPALLSNLEVFYDEKNHVDVYHSIYMARLELKKKLKTVPWGSQEYAELNDTQTAYKLLLNAASGAADPKSPNVKNNIRKNNAIVSMRIIGQLFAWRIGQAQALHGARVPSVNTDGLYIMGISKEENKRVLDNVTKNMLIKVDPEEVTKFVSKDTNNRLEVEAKDGVLDPKTAKIDARGGILTSHVGPTVLSNVDHPAAIDYALTQYLAFVDDAVNKDFDPKLGKLALESILIKYDKPEALRFFQWIIASKPSTPRIAFKQNITIDDGDIKVKSFESMQHYNRVFLTKPENESNRIILSLAGTQKLKPAELKKLNANHESVEHDPIAYQILKKSNLIPKMSPDDVKRIKQVKVTKMPNLQNVTIDNRDLFKIAQTDIIDHLDWDAYLQLLEDAFETFHN